MRPRSLAVIHLLVLLALSCGEERVGPGEGGSVASADPGYLAEIEHFRSEREERLRGENGWLSLVGLFWLEPGSNPLGSAESSAVRLPEGAAPPEAGDLVYDGETVRLVPREGAGMRIGDSPAAEQILRDDSEGPPDVIELGRLRFYVIRRGDRHGVRVKDPESPARLGFRGLSWFPVDPTLRVEARLDAFETPRELAVPTVLGTPTVMLAPGAVEFRMDGRDYSLLPLIGEPGQTDLFFVFRDATSGHETYGAGRFLYAELDGDRVVLDFNRAYNPPCAYTPFATCPLPPPENRLADLAIRAGEKIYAIH